MKHLYFNIMIIKNCIFVIKKYFQRNVSDVQVGATEVVDVTMHMVAQERHFQAMKKTFWEFREMNMYTDLTFSWFPILFMVAVFV